MKKRLLSLIMALMLPALPAGAQEALPKIGLCIYNQDDTFIASLRSVLENQAAGLAELSVRDAQNNQNTQNNQVVELLDAGTDVMIVNPVDRTASIYLLRMAMQKDVPIVFINREPLKADLSQYDKAYYVGVDAKHQGYQSGETAAEYFRSVPQADLNGDGNMQLVIFKGEPGHQDAELRTQYTLLALHDKGVAVDLISEEVALWERSLGQERMAALLNTYDDHIECVISNNDDMALGAIDALKAAGYFSGGKTMPVFGVDATASALEAIRQGSLYATVSNNADLQGAAALSLALLLARGEAITDESFPYHIEDKMVYIDSLLLRKKDLQ